jgi:hypothetical protein
VRFELSVGHPIDWRPHTQSQRLDHVRYPDWVIAEDRIHTHLMGEQTVLIQPPDQAHRARRVMVAQVFNKPEPIPAIELLEAA